MHFTYSTPKVKLNLPQKKNVNIQKLKDRVKFIVNSCK